MTTIYSLSGLRRTAVGGCAQYRETVWRKSDRSANGSECVEVASMSDRVAVRDSKCPWGGVLSFHVSRWREFLGAAKQDRFRPLLH